MWRGVRNPAPGGLCRPRRQGHHCGGCGESIEYPAASHDELISDRPSSKRSSRRGAEKEAGGRENAGKRRRGVRGKCRTDERIRSGQDDTGVHSINWRSWLPGLIAGLIGGALVLIVLAIASGGGDSDHGSAPGGKSANSSTPTSPPASAPTPTAPVAKRQSRPSQDATKLDQRRLAARVSIGVPRGWNAGVEGGAVTLSARNGKAEVQVYYEEGARSDLELARASKEIPPPATPGRSCRERRTDWCGRGAGQKRSGHIRGRDRARPPSSWPAATAI